MKAKAELKSFLLSNETNERLREEARQKEFQEDIRYGLGLGWGWGPAVLKGWQEMCPHPGEQPQSMLPCTLPRHGSGPMRSCRYMKEYAAQLEKQELERLAQLERTKAVQARQAEDAKSRPPVKKFVDPAIIEKQFQ